MDLKRRYRNTLNEWHIDYSIISASIRFRSSYSALFCLPLFSADSNEYCQWETFNATCSDPDEVILMLTARYGRMQFGRCMREDHGSVGCSANVIAHMDRKCSGRRTCQLTIPDASLHSIHQCPKEIMPYLEATYTCINGILQLLTLLLKMQYDTMQYNTIQLNKMQYNAM